MGYLVELVEKFRNCSGRLRLRERDEVSLGPVESRERILRSNEGINLPENISDRTNLEEDISMKSIGQLSLRFKLSVQSINLEIEENLKILFEG